jgi:hypothetical protein
MHQGLSGSSKLIIAARGHSKEQSQIQADPIFGPYGITWWAHRDDDQERGGRALALLKKKHIESVDHAELGHPEFAVSITRERHAIEGSIVRDRISRLVS